MCINLGSCPRAFFNRCRPHSRRRSETSDEAVSGSELSYASALLLRYMFPYLYVGEGSPIQLNDRVHAQNDEEA